MYHVEGEGGSAQGHPVRQEGHHEIRHHNRDEAVDYSCTKVEDAYQETGDDEVDVVLEFRQREDEFAVEDGQGES